MPKRFRLNEQINVTFSKTCSSSHTTVRKLSASFKYGQVQIRCWWVLICFYAACTTKTCILRLSQNIKLDSIENLYSTSSMGCSCHFKVIHL